MLTTRFASILLAGAALALVGSTGCTSSSNPDPQKTNHRLLTDTDRDGLFSSEECDDPRPVIECGGPGADDHQEPGDDGDTPMTNTGCTVVPGPAECAFLEVFSSGTNGDSGGGMDPTDPTTGGTTTPPDAECYQCLDENGDPVGDPVCNTPSPISCEPYDPGPTGQNSTCWTCTDGDTTYTECYDPPQTCETDADCAAGETCVTPQIDCGPGENCPDIAAVPMCVGSGDDPAPPPSPDPTGL